MPDYRRPHQPGGSFFFTVVTYDRTPFLCDDTARQILRHAITLCQTQALFVINAFVLLPDHLHTIWTLPPDDGDFGRRWGMIKKEFTRDWTSHGGWQGDVSTSRQNNHRRGVWQRRFWEHLLRDERDVERHLDYIHFNPVKHGYVSCPHLWQFSSFHRLVKEKKYAANWGCSCEGRKPELPVYEKEERIKQTFGE